MSDQGTNLPLGIPSRREHPDTALLPEAPMAAKPAPTAKEADLPKPASKLYALPTKPIKPPKSKRALPPYWLEALISVLLLGLMVAGFMELHGWPLAAMQAALVIGLSALTKPWFPDVIPKGKRLPALRAKTDSPKEPTGPTSVEPDHIDHSAKKEQ